MGAAVAAGDSASITSRHRLSPGAVPPSVPWWPPLPGVVPEVIADQDHRLGDGADEDDRGCDSVHGSCLSV